MEIKTANQEYLEKAKLLTKEDAERLQLRMFGKLPLQQEETGLSTLEALAMQLELEDVHLNDWRERRAKIKAKVKV